MTAADKKVKGTVFNIQKYSLHDGPGIRTVVFLKGCPLRCRWCSNPESQEHAPQLAFNVIKCLTVEKCKRCMDICPQSALNITGDDTIAINREKCIQCMTCAAACPAGALNVFGQEKTVDEVLSIVEQDAAFYARSEGGMTLGGGEPLAQPEFTLALLQEARFRRIHTAMETCAQAPYTALEEACSLLRVLLTDIKTVDNTKHKAGTGASNKHILKNFQKIATRYPRLPIIVRTPLVPGINDTEKDILAIAAFIKAFPNVSYEILPYHRLGTQKYMQLDKENPMGKAQLDKAVYEHLSHVAAKVLGDKLVDTMKKHE